MQGIGHILLPKESIRVLWRSTLKKDGSGYRTMKLRTTGENGELLVDESIFLSTEFQKVEDLKAGKTIRL